MKLLKKTFILFLVMLTIFTSCSLIIPVLAADDVSLVTDGNVDEEETSNTDEEYPEPEIISEVTEKREENLKHFILSDGSFMVAKYNTSIHYQTGDGQWVDYNNKLTEVEASTEQVELFGTNELYSTSNAIENIVFAEKSNSNTLVAYESMDYPISLNYKSIKKSNINITKNDEELTGNDAFLTLQNVTQEVIYEDAFNDVDLQYIVTPEGLKENIVLKSKSAQNSFTVNYNIGELTAEVVDEHTINLMADNEIIYTISAPYMVDSNGVKSEAVTLDVDKNKNGKLRVNILADSKWLQAAERIYPVVVDPMVSEGDLTDICSSFVSSSNPTVNYGASETIYAASGSTEYGTAYALLDLGDFSDIGYDSQLVSMKLNLNLSSNVETETYAYAYGITSQWDYSSVTWNTKPSISSLVTDYAKISVGKSSLSFDVTKLYNDTIFNNQTCYGVAIKKIDSGTLPITLSENNEPYVTYTYLNTAGLSDKYSYTEFDMGSAGTVHINNFSGNMILTRDDISSTGEKQSYDLTSAYNSKTVYEEDYPCWVRSYEAGFLTIMMYVDEYGTLNFYNGTESETESDTYILEENDQEFEKITVTDFEIKTITLPIIGNLNLKIPIAFDVCSNNNTEKSHYTMSGLDSKIIDINENGNGKTVFSRAYDYDENGNKISGTFYIVDGDNDKLKIVETDSSCSVTQLDIKEDGTVIEEDTLLYIYDEQGLVSEIKYNGITQGTFTYDENGLMTSVTNNDGYRLDFTYNAEQRAITSVTESKNGVIGQKMELTRSYNKSVFRTSGADGIYNTTDDVLTTYNFDTAAKLISTYASTASGENLSAVDYEYKENNEALKGFGGISKISASGIEVNNLIKDHNAESLNNWTAEKFDDSGCAHTSVVSSDKAYIGLKSLKHTVTDVTTNGGATFRQNFSSSNGIIEGGKTYTASAYINTSGLTRDADTNSSFDYGAAVMVNVKTPSGETRYYSENIHKTDSTINDGWERVFTSFTVPQNYTNVSVELVLRNATGTAYYDAIQLEEGDVANAYNMLENNDFTYSDSNGFPIGWRGLRTDSTELVEKGELKIVGNVAARKAVVQDVYLKNPSQEDTYFLSGWAHADSAPMSSGRYYLLCVGIFYDNNTIYYQQPFSYYNYYDGGKQYTSMGFDLKNEDYPDAVPTRMHIMICYYNQINTAYFDNLSLVKSNDVYDLKELSQESEDTATTEAYTYNEDGSIATYTDEEGVVYTYSYDSLGNITSVLNSEGKGDRNTYYYYDTDNDGVNDTADIATETYEDGTQCSYEYDSSRNLITETVIDGETTTVYTYNTAGQLITESEAPGKTYNYSYDDYGNVVSKLDSDGNGDRYTYQYFDLNNNSEYDNYEVSYESLENGEENWYTYNNEANLTRMVRKKNGSTVAYNYDSTGNQTSVEHNGFSYNYTYNEFGNTTSVKVGEQNLVSYDYSQDKSKLASLTYGNGLTENYTYNPYGQIKTKTITGIGTINYGYDSVGTLIYEKDTVGGRDTYYKYDDDGNYLGIRVNSANKTNEYDNCIFSDINNLDSEGNVTKNTTILNKHSYSTAYTYDEDGLPLTSAMTSTRILNHTYDSESRLTQRTLSTDTPLTETFTYSEEGYISEHAVGNEEYEYTYDQEGNITEIKKDGILTQSYVYDADNQLVRENNRDINKSIVYTYDGYGNILNKKEYAYTVGDLGAVTDTVTYTYDSTWKDKLTSYDGESIAYDSIGNPTTYRGATLTWSGRNLMSYTKGSLNVSYTYGADGLRTSKTVNGVTTEYYYRDGQLVGEKLGNTDLIWYRYDADGRLALVLRKILSTGGLYYYYPVLNTRGDIIELHSGSGALSARYTYDSWGKLISVVDGSGATIGAGRFAHYVSLRYRGYYYDAETELYYLQSRYYDPEVGRFLNADDVNFIGYSGENLSYNAFAYCENEPINDIDYDGYISLKSVKDFFANVISVIADYIKNYITNLIKIENGVLSISTTVFEVTFNTIISSFCAGKIVNAATPVLKYVLNKYKNKAPQIVVDILKYVIERLNKTGLIRTIAKFIATKLVVRKTVVKDSAISTIAKDFLAGILLSNSALLQKVNTICSAMSSIGGFISFLISGFDKNWFDGRFKINITSFKRSYL